jgi:hypothetical protein
MRRAALLSLLACCACALSLAGAGTAAADLFTPIELVSARPVQTGSGPITEQAESAEQSVISGNGRYVAFVGSFGGVRGIWRRDLETGAVEQVAPGHALLPSISKEGNYVSFTTNERLAPKDDHNDAPDVYVRDMEKPCGEAGGPCTACSEQEQAGECPFVLVSAVNGSSEGTSYHYTGAEPNEEQNFGSLASARSAMSASGHLVVFETEAESELLGVPTPAREILLRNLETDATTLVSAEYDPENNTDTGVPVPLTKLNETSFVGAAYPITAAFGAAPFGGASISADGSTVAWLGQEIARQAKLLPGEQESYDPEYDEPLWRRVEAGPSAPTQRVTGGSEPENPLCAASGQSELPATPSLLDPCQGPFALFSQTPTLERPSDYLLEGSLGVNVVPQLSEHGEKVAFLVSAHEAASGQQFPGADNDDDLYISEIGGSSTRVQALRRLTEIGGEPSKLELAAKIVDLAISPDGRQVAFTTRRTLFPLASPSYISSVEAKSGIKELFDADLASETITRVTHGYAGEAVPSEQPNNGVPGEALPEADGASSPSFSENGETLSFSSSADNLVFGDGNGASDAFLANRLVLTGETPQQLVSGPPPPPLLQPAWQLYASAVPEPDGAVVLDVDVPGAGELAAGASANVPVTVRAKNSSRARPRARRAARAHTALLTRAVASAHAVIPLSTDGLEQLTLALTPSYRALAQRGQGLYTTIAVHFTAPGHPSLSVTLHVTFRRTTPVPHAKTARRSTRTRKKGHGR